MLLDVFYIRVGSVMKDNFNSSQNYYKDAGVDTEKADRLVSWIAEENSKKHSKCTLSSNIGGFAGSYDLGRLGLKQPVLIASTDGVGTKLLMALDSGRLESLGQDLVAMCVNDLYTSGASPLFFLDYYASGKLDELSFKVVLSGIKKALNLCSCTLLGGETAELPGLYQKEHFDLAGFVVGAVEKKGMIRPENVREGDLIYVLPSSGFHSNGYSLLRKWCLEKPNLFNQEVLAKLLTPTRIYSRLPLLFKQCSPDVIHALSHITGGGIAANLSRVIPKGLSCYLNKSVIPTPLWMKNFLLNFSSDIFSFESVFNLGVGMMILVAKEQQRDFESCLREHFSDAVVVGEVRSSCIGEKKVHFV